MAATWPPQYHQSQHQPLPYGLSQYQQLNGPQPSQQAFQQPYPPGWQNPHYMQQSHQYPQSQQPPSYSGYNQQAQYIPNSAQSFQVSSQPAQHDYQGYSQPPSVPTSVAYSGYPAQPSLVPQHGYPLPQHQYGAPQQAITYGQAPGQSPQYHQAQQAFTPQRHHNLALQSPSQQRQLPQASIPQQNQYAVPQSPTKQQPPESPASSEKDKQQEKKPTVACFNCGSFDHWAVSCPEPQRAVPAGVVNRQNQQPPSKRQKFNAPIITKYQVPSHVFQGQNPPQAYQPPLGYPNFQPQTQHQIPPTPVSAHISPQGQWLPAAPYQNSQQPSHMGYQAQQQANYQQYPYPQMPPTPSQSNAISPVNQYPSKTSAQASPVNLSQPQQYITHHARSSAQPSISASPHTAFPAFVEPQVSQHQQASQVNPVHVPGRNHEESLSNNSRITTPKHQSPKEETCMSMEDELQLLDIPDIPVDQDSSIPSLVAQPLPTNFIVADALAPFAAPAIGDKGCCKSKYLDRPGLNDVNQNVRQTGEWEKHKKDPIFNDIMTNTNVILLSVLDMIYRPARSYEDDVSSEARADEINNHLSRKESEEQGLAADPEDSSNDLRKPVAIQNSDRSTQRRRSQSNSPQYSPSPTIADDVPAFPGIGKEAKGAKLPRRPYPPPTPQEKVGDSGQSSRSRSGSPRRCSSNAYQDISPPDSGADAQSRREAPSLDRRNSYHREDSYRWTDKPNTQRFERLPPPPPPPGRRPSWYDGPNSSPISVDTSLPKRPNTILENPFSNSGSQNFHPSDSHVMSPMRLRAERSYSLKREYSHRDESSDEDETARRRQADDVTPKLKRRQPKVAEAYSRRW